MMSASGYNVAMVGTGLAGAFSPARYLERSPAASGALSSLRLRIIDAAAPPTSS